MRLSITIMILATLGSAGFSQSPDEAFLQANEQFREGNYARAAEMYESILTEGLVSAPLYFNLGNSYYRMGRMAQAILAYERALRLDPGDDDAAFNLRLAKMRTIDRIEPVPELFLISWLKAMTGILSLRTTVWIFVIAWGFLFGALAAFFLLVNEAWSQMLRWVILGSLVAVVGCGIILGLQVSRFGQEDEAVIMADVVTVKSSPDAQSLDAFVIHSGLTVRVEDAVGDWTKIVLADGKIGWVRSSAFERI